MVFQMDGQRPLAVEGAWTELAVVLFALRNNLFGKFCPKIIMDKKVMHQPVFVFEGLFANVTDVILILSMSLFVFLPS